MTKQQKKLVEGTDIELYDQAKWSRATVADGKWLQNETLEPISANDRILASAIHNTSANLTTYIDDSIDEVYENLSAISIDIYNKIDYVSATVDNNAVAFQNLVEYVSGDLTSQIFNTSSFLQNEIDTNTQDLRNEISATSSYLQGEIDTLEAATDVVDVIGDLSTLSSYSGRITSADIIKVLNASGPWTDPITHSAYNFSGDQVYFRYTGKTTAHPNSAKWTYVGELDPYYNKTEIDNKITTLSSTVSSNYLSANKTAVSAGHNIVISANPTEPKILIKTSDNVTFDGISATTLTASTAYGQSAKFDNISSTNLTALTASGNQASYTNISGTTLSGATASINIDNLITAATAGAVSYSGKNGIQINDHDIMLSAKMSAIGNGITNSSAISLSSFKLSADTGITFNATTDTLGISVSSSIINSAEAGASASAYITANSGKFLNSAHSAFSKVTVTFYRDASQGQHFNDVFNANNSSAEFKFKLGDDLFGERDSSDTFIITTNNTAITADAMPKTRAYTAAGNGITNPYTGYLSALYLSAGNGITFDTTNNKLGILADSALINSAKSGQSAYNWLTANTDSNSAKWAKNATSATNAANADSATSAYNTQNLGGVSSTNIIGSAESGKDAWNTLSSATFTANGTTAKLSGGFNLSAGQGITIIHNAGEQKIGISAEGTSYTTGRGIAINGTVISVKDEFVPWSAEDAPIGTNNNALNTAFAQGTNNIATNASFAQGDSSRAGDKSFSQGTNNSASFISFAQGELNGANRDSFAQGYNNTAYYYSFAQGSANNASSYSFAQGINNNSDSYSFAQGASNTAKTYSFSQGNENIATGLSFANGMSNIAGNNSFTQGHENSADSFSFAVGMDNIASSFAFAQGDSNNVKDHAFAQGASNTANKYSVAIGQWCSAYEYGQAFGDSTVISGGMAIGNCNASTAGVAFVIGNGINNNNRHDLFSINHSGDITINWSAIDPNVSPDTITGETIIGGYYVNTKYNTVGGTGQDTTAQATWIDMMSNQVRFAYSADLAHSAEKILGGPAGDTLQPVYLTTSGTIQSCGTINRALDIEVISTASGTEGNVGTLDTSMEQIAVDTIVLQPKQATEQGEHNNLNINRLIKGKVYKVFMVSSSLSWSLYLQRINSNGDSQQFVVVDNNGRHNNNYGWIAEGMRQRGYNTSSTIYLIRTDNDKILIMYGY